MLGCHGYDNTGRQDNTVYEQHIVYTFHPRGLREHGFDTSCFVCLEIVWIQQLCTEAMPTVQCEARESRACAS